ncbi:MAG: hypothetical protein MN733_12245 [Nitrososphaera sp.]|nr:hypothetical protein [Nitrososphaera sp.]
MRFVTQLQLIDFDLQGYLGALDAKMEETTKQAAQSWLRTVLDIIPTWSKASRATFEALAREVGFSVTYGPLIAKKDRTSLGLSTGRGGLDIQRHVGYFFFYETDLRYLEYNQFNNAVPGPPPQPFGQLRNPTPYRFIEAGQNDFQSFAKAVKLPNPALFISGRPI